MTKVYSIGNSLGTTIPIWVIKLLKIEKGDNLNFEQEKGAVYIKKAE